MRSFALASVLATMLAGCTTMNVQQSDVQAFCQIACDCDLLNGVNGVTPANCPAQCVNAVGAQVIPDACMSCLYEYEHECGVITQVCNADCQTQQATPLLERVEEGGS